MLEKIKNVSIKKEIVLQNIGKEEKYFALNVESGDCFELNHSSYFILELLHKNDELEVVISKIQDKYGISLDDAKNDLCDMIKNGLELGILKC